MISNSVMHADDSKIENDFSLGKTLKDTNLVVSLSFDDGLKSDITLAELLEKYNLRATFFITAGKIGKGHTWLSEEDVRWLSEIHEVGSHSLYHKCLITISVEELMHELKYSRELIQRITEKRVVGFSYPYGIFNKYVVEAVRRVGYLYARSTRSFWIGTHRRCINPYTLPVTLPLYPVKLIGSIIELVKKLKRVFLRAFINKYARDIKYLLQKIAKRDYVDTFKLAENIISILLELSEATYEQYIVILWGHSWEIVFNKDLKSKFEELLAYISGLRNKVKVVTLQEIIQDTALKGVAYA